MLKIRVEERFGKLKVVVYLPKPNNKWMSNGGYRISPKNP